MNSFLRFNERNILEHAGKISHESALNKAEKEYDKFSRRRIKEKDETDSDFDRAVKKLEAKTN